MTRQEVQTAVLDVLAAVIGNDVNAGSTRKNTPHWDSLKHLEVIFAVEDTLNIRFNEETLADLDSVAKIVAAAESRHAP